MLTSENSNLKLTLCFYLSSVGYTYDEVKIYEVYGKMGSSGYPGKNGGTAGLHAVDGNLNLVFIKNHTGNNFNVLKKYKGE